MESTLDNSTSRESTQPITVKVASLSKAAIVKRWLKWALILAATAIGGAVLLALFRSWPQDVHSFVERFPAWMRIVCTFAVCAVAAHEAIAYFQPRRAHLKWAHPPVWAAIGIGIIAIGGLDLTTGIVPGEYQAAGWEWAFYGLGAAIAAFAFWTTCDTPSIENTTPLPASQRQQFPEDWDTLKEWLASESPAAHDYLGNVAMAERLKDALVRGVRAIGLVGPFGSGKTTIVNWIVELASKDASAKQRIVFSPHSCWGFETSASAIHAMLSDAVSRIGRYVDTCAVRSLPNSYRQLSAAGGEWLDKFLSIVFRQRDPMDQFAVLNDLLKEAGVRLILIVEDLDRTGTATFDVQEVLGLLQRLKDYPQLSFILTGGTATPPRIDFAKLCDQIENLKTLTTKQAGNMIALARRHCLNDEEFTHRVLSGGDDDQWNPPWWTTQFDRSAVLAPQALSRLLSTPRSLRHTLRRTHVAWSRLGGEVDWDHLLVLTALRCNAFEAFMFVEANWSRLTYPRSRFGHDDDEIAQAKSYLEGDWSRSCQGVEWDEPAARRLVDFLFPRSPFASGDSSFDDSARIQGIQDERYWRRAFDEAVPEGEVRDQTVIHDMIEWLESPAANSPFVDGICGRAEYSDAWEHVAGIEGSQTEKFLLLCEQVVVRILTTFGPASSHKSPGFAATWRVAKKYASYRAENRSWLEARIAEAAKTSLEMVQALWHFYGSPGGDSLLRREDHEPVRRYTIQVLKAELNDGEKLATLLAPEHPYALYQLVFDSGSRPTSHTGLESWGWLGPVMLDGLRNRDGLVAGAVCRLIAKYEDDGFTSKPAAVDPVLLQGFFGDCSDEAIHAIEQTIEYASDDERELMGAIVSSARILSTPDVNPDEE